MKPVDLATWPRRPMFELFSEYADPYFDLAVRIRVPGLRHALSRRRHDAFGVVLQAIGCAVNEQPALRLRLHQRKVVCFDTVHPSWVVVGHDGVMRFANGRHDDDLEVFLASVERTSALAAKRPGLAGAHAWDDFVYLRHLPEVELLGARMQRSGRPSDSVPHVMWGAIVDDAIGMTISAHHGLVDETDVVAFVASVRGRLESYVAASVATRIAAV